MSLVAHHKGRQTRMLKLDSTYRRSHNHAASTSSTGASAATARPAEASSVSTAGIGRRGRWLLVAHRSRPTHTQSCGVLPVPTYDLKSLSAHEVHAAT